MKKSLLFLLVLLLVMTGCGTPKEEDTTADVANEDTSNTKSNDAASASNGKELKISNTDSLIVQNTDDDIVIDPTEDDIIDEADSEISIDTIFTDSNGDGVIHGESNEVVNVSTTITNNGSADYTISQLDFILHGGAPAAVSVTDPLSMDGFTTDSSSVKYDVEFTIPAKESVAIVVSTTVEHEIYNNEFDILTLDLIADPSDAPEYSYRYKYTLDGEESNGEEFDAPGESTSSEVNKDNILTIDGEGFTENTNGDNLVGNEGDEELTGAQGREKYKLDPTIVVTDKGGDGTLDLGEKAHAVVSIANTSDKTYTIQHLDLSTSSIDYYEGDVTNITNTIGDDTLSYENGGIDSADSSYIKEFDIAPGDTATFEFDFVMNPTDEDSISVMTSDNSRDYISVSFMADDGAGNTLYYETDNVKLNFSDFAKDYQD